MSQRLKRRSWHRRKQLRLKDLLANFRGNKDRSLPLLLLGGYIITNTATLTCTTGALWNTFDSSFSRPSPIAHRPSRETLRLMHSHRSHLAAGATSIPATC